jgi:hypothetical protein
MSLSFCSSRYCWLSLFWAWSAMSAPCLYAHDESKLTEILDVWRTREEAAKTVSFELVGEHPAVAGALERPAQMRRSLVIDGVKMRTEKHADGFKPEYSLEVFDGVLRKTLTRSKLNDDEFTANGWISAVTNHSEVRNMHLSPVIHHFRPLSSTFGVIKHDRLQVVKINEAMKGVSCVILEEDWGDGMRTARYWVAPSRDMAILRHERHFRGKKELLVEAAFEHQARNGWVPTSWTATSFRDGDIVFSASKVAVTYYDINAKIPEGTFDLTFPPGTEVFDRVSKIKHIVPAKPAGR